MAIGTGIKSAINAGKGMVKSGFLKDTVAPGLKSAFSQAGGMKGLGRRVLGGAAIGGAATGTVSALRGGDFWEGAKSGALAGGLGGAGRHAYQMGQTNSGRALGSSMQNYKTNKGSTLSLPSPGTNTRRSIPNQPLGLPGTPGNQTTAGSFSGVMRNSGPRVATQRNSPDERMRRAAELSNQRKRRRVSGGGVGNNRSTFPRNLTNVSKQVHTQTRLNGVNQAAQSIVKI